MSKIYRKAGYGNCGYEIWIEFFPSGFNGYMNGLNRHNNLISGYQYYCKRPEC